MLNNRIEKQGDESMIKIFSKPNCNYCLAAKNYLDQLDIEYDIVDITKNPMAHSFLVSEGHRTVPQFYQEETLLFEGGYTELIKYSKEEINEMMGESINVSELGFSL